MKATFKPLGLAAAVAAASAGYAGTAAAQVYTAQAERSLGNLGDLAIVPYYTVQDEWVTGVHIINSSDYTQVVKMRLRRATDSADVMDINLVMSPKDEWVGSLNDNGTDGKITWTAGANQDGDRDTTCTVPIREDGVFEMRSKFADSEEGYIEIIGMGTPDLDWHGDETDAPIAYYSEHVDGVPRDCETVASNFFENLTIDLDDQTVVANPFAPGNLGDDITSQALDADQIQKLLDMNPSLECFTDSGDNITSQSNDDKDGVCINRYHRATDTALAVSYFIRDADTGIEMGGNAVHIAGASHRAWMTNQQRGLTSIDPLPTPFGVDYPDLGGGPWRASFGNKLGKDNINGPVEEDLIDFEDPLSGVDLGLDRVAWNLYQQLRRPDILGVAGVLNDWSMAAARGVSTDWVVTLPGQYNMIDYFVWFTEFFDVSDCGTGDPDDGDAVPLCDFRDIPVGLEVTIYDREEGVEEVEDPGLIISPAPTIPGVDVELPNEVNILEWTDGENTPVLGSAYNTTINPKALGLGESGWAFLSVSQDKKNIRGSGFGTTGNLICQWNPLFNLNDDFEFDTDEVRDSPVCPVHAEGDVPIVGFVAWERVFETNPTGNYGRLIDHSFVSAPFEPEEA